MLQKGANDGPSAHGGAVCELHLLSRGAPIVPIAKDSWLMTCVKANTIRGVYYDVDIYGLMAISPYVDPSVRNSYSIALALEE